MSSFSRSVSPSLANSSVTSRSTPDKDDTASDTDERGEEFEPRKVAASPTSTITPPPKACEQDDAIVAASLRYAGQVSSASAVTTSSCTCYQLFYHSFI